MPTLNIHSVIPAHWRSFYDRSTERTLHVTSLFAGAIFIIYVTVWVTTTDRLLRGNGSGPHGHRVLLAASPFCAEYGGQ